MSTQNSVARCSYCLAVNSVPSGNAKCCCASCGRIFELSQAPKAAVWQASPIHPSLLEPPAVVSRPPVNYATAPVPKIASWPWPALSSRSEESRHKFFSIAFRHLALISAPLFALMLTLAIGYDVGVLSLIVIIPCALLSGLAMGLGQAWIVDNAYREGKTFWKVWWIPCYMHYYMLTRWSICWRPLGLITLGGAFYVSLLFYLMADQLGAAKVNNASQFASKALEQTAKPVDSTTQVAPAPQGTSAMDFSPATQMPPSRQSASARNAALASRNNSQLKQNDSSPASETVWSYESLNTSPPVIRDAQSHDEAGLPALIAPVQSPVIESTAPLASEQDGGFREWSNSTGSYKLVAKFDAIDAADGKFVQLRTKDGRKIRVEIAKLSAADRRFLEPIVQSSPFEVVGDEES